MVQTDKPAGETMSVSSEDIDRLAKEFKECRQILSALGDESRQHLILEMMQMDDCNGVRVGEITKRANLSRPAVSHHIRILREAGILKMRREGTKNYYYFDVDAKALNDLTQMIAHVRAIMEFLPDRGGNRDTGGKST